MDLGTTHLTGPIPIEGATLYGTGVGLRGPHVPQILREQPAVPWFELLTDNHLVNGGELKFQATAISELYPVALHGVGMSLGGTGPLNWEYIGKVRDLARDIDAVHISEHLSFTAHNKIYSHELLPLPRTELAIRNVAKRIGRIQDYLGQRLLLENVSTYIDFVDQDYNEGEFIAEVCQQADCDLLLDVNNVYVNSINHDLDPAQTFASIPWHRVKEIHVAGHSQRGPLVLDSHSGPVCDEVIELLLTTLSQAPTAPVLVEWDTQLPSWDTLWTEVMRIESIRRQAAVMEGV